MGGTGMWLVKVGEQIFKPSVDQDMAKEAIGKPLKDNRRFKQQA